MSKEEFNVLLMICKRGFRHTPAEQRFIATQLDWVYSYNEKKIATVARNLMSFVMGQWLALDRNTRPPAPLTNIMLSNETDGSYTISEQLSINKDFNVVVMKAAHYEYEELMSILNNEKVTTKPSDLSIYLNGLASSETYSKLPTGTSFSDFIISLSNFIKDADTWLVPLYMTHDNNLEKHQFSITFMTKDPNSTYVLKIDTLIV